MQDILHFKQLVQTNTFEMYDFGNPDVNMQHYNQTTPPTFDLTKFGVNTALFTGSVRCVRECESVA